MSHLSLLERPPDRPVPRAAAPAEPTAPEPDQLPLNGAPAERTLVD
jgi:hypothetical protein